MMGEDFTTGVIWPSGDAMASSEALSARDIAQLYPTLTTERDARRLLLARVRDGETGDAPFAPTGAPLKVQGTWLTTLGSWRQVVTVDGDVR